MVDQRGDGRVGVFARPRDFAVCPGQHHVRHAGTSRGPMIHDDADARTQHGYEPRVVLAVSDLRHSDALLSDSCGLLGGTHRAGPMGVRRSTCRVRQISP